MVSSPPTPVSDDDGVTGAEQREAAKKFSSRRKFRRRLSGALVLALGLTAAGFAVSALTPDQQEATASDAMVDEALIREGKNLYDTSCVTCHGNNLQGVKDRGPSLAGIGQGSVYFQVHSGRMPMTRNEAQVRRKPPKFNERQTLALAAYVHTKGGGTEIVTTDGKPVKADGSNIAMTTLRGKGFDGNMKAEDIARGSELFRLNCASCHNFTGRGGALSSGKLAPPLDPANEQEIYQAMATGPQNMPKFSDRQLSPDEKKDIIAFVKNSGESLSPGGYGLGGFGPGTEGLFIWTVGIVALVGATLWIGARS